jgi:hypothetical protein
LNVLFLYASTDICQLAGQRSVVCYVSFLCARECSLVPMFGWARSSAYQLSLWPCCTRHGPVSGPTFCQSVLFAFWATSNPRHPMYFACIACQMILAEVQHGSWMFRPSSASSHSSRVPTLYWCAAFSFGDLWLWHICKAIHWRVLSCLCWAFAQACVLPCFRSMLLSSEPHRAHGSSSVLL